MAKSSAEDTLRVRRGPNTLAVRAFDGVERSELVLVGFSFCIPGDNARMPLAIGALVLVLSAASASLLLRLGRGRPR